MARTFDDAAFSRKARLLLVDDHPVLGWGVERLVNAQTDMKFCGAVRDYGSALTAIRELQPDIVLVEISLKGTNGLELTRQVRRRFPGVCVLVYSAFEDPSYLAAALRAGAHGFAMKCEPPEQLVEAIRQVLRGLVYVREPMRETVFRAFAGRQDGEASLVATLSEREREVFDLIGRGQRRKQIAASLSVGVRTVETHMLRIRKKLGLRHAEELAQTAAAWRRFPY